MNRLQGRIALITGGASGLGAQIGARFTEEGATVVVNDLLAADEEAMAAELGGDSIGVLVLGEAYRLAGDDGGWIAPAPWARGRLSHDPL